MDEPSRLDPFLRRLRAAALDAAVVAATENFGSEIGILLLKLVRTIDRIEETIERSKHPRKPGKPVGAKAKNPKRVKRASPPASNVDQSDRLDDSPYPNLPDESLS